MPGKAAPVACVRQVPLAPPQVKLAGNPPSEEYPESSPPESGVPSAANWGDAKLEIVAPFGFAIAQLIASAE